MKPKFPISPSHWLLNAGMIGLLEVLEHGLEEESKAKTLGYEVRSEDGWFHLPRWDELKEKLLLPDGSVEGYWLVRLIYRYLHEPAPRLSYAKKLHWWYITHPNQPPPATSHPPKDRLESVAKRLFNKAGIYSNMINLGGDVEKNFTSAFSWSKIFSKDRYLPRQCFILGETKFGVESLSLKWASYLFPSPGQFPNAFWGSAQKEEGVPQVATPVAYLITCHHLAWTKIGGGVEVFINAPSFRLMYDLNKVLRSLFFGGKELQDILALSLIGYALRIQRMLTAWTYQNIELIVKKGESIHSYTLPADIARLLLDAKVARSLSQLSPKVSTLVLQLLLSRKFGEIEDLLYKELRRRLLEGKVSSDIESLLQLTGRIREIQKSLSYELIS